MSGSVPTPPALVREVEIAAPLPSIAQVRARSGAPYGSCWLLVRLHTVPLGTIEIPFADGALTAARMACHVGDALGDVIAAHLRADGLTMDGPLSADGIKAPHTPRCIAHRTAVGAAGLTVSVVVPCADRPELLRRTVLDLRAQDYPAFEIIVVDNAPVTSGASAVVAELPPDGVPVRYVVEPRAGSSPARNRGVAAATSDLVAFVDADVRVDRYWLLELVAPFVSDPAVGATTGLILPSELETPAQRWMEEWGGYGKGFEPRSFDLGPHRGTEALFPYSASLGSGQSMAFRTSLFRHLGGFDDALGVRTPAMGGEDIAVLLDAILDGSRVAYAPGSIVWHPHPEGARAFLDKLRSYGVGLTAHLTRVVVRRPRSAIEIAVRLPAAVRYFYAQGSARNRGHGPGFPARAVRRAELVGMAQGPFAYFASRAADRRRRASPSQPR